MMAEPKVKTLKHYQARRDKTRIYIQTLTVENASADYTAWLEDPDVLRYLEVRHNVQNEEKIKAFIEEMWESDANLLTGIFLQEDGRHIGNIKMGPVSWRYQRADVGIIIGEKECWGKGLAVEAIDAMCDVGFSDLNLRRIGAGAYAGNGGSVRAFEKAGFKIEGVMKEYWEVEGQPEDNIYMGKLAKDHR